MTTDNENSRRPEPNETVDKAKAPWNNRFGSDENLKQRKYSRTSRNQPVKEASNMSRVLLGILFLTVLTPFLLYWFVKANTPTNNNTPQTATSVMITRKSEATTESKAEEETTTSGTFVQNGNNEGEEETVAPVDVNETTAEVTQVTQVTEPPVTEAVTEAQPSGQTHTVSAGETWYGIARTYGVDVNALAAANGVTTDSPIYPGNTLVIP